MAADIIMFPGIANLADEGLQIIEDSESLAEALAMIDLLAEERGIMLTWLYQAMRKRAQEQNKLLSEVDDLIAAEKWAQEYARGLL